MRYIDNIYGEVEIIDNVVLDIINSKDFQRLKGVDQAGYFDVYFPGTKHSRFEHSVGCYILLKKFGASVEEQIAGLIHDISHSAFSHTADYVFDTGRGADHNYQDDIFEDFVRQTEIPEILSKYGFDVDYILDENNFPLQETDLPNLCADRIDYSLRGAFHYEKKIKNELNYFLKHLKVINNKWIFDTFEAAYRYATLFEKLNNVYYSNVQTAAMFQRSSKWIKYAFDKGYLNHKDLFKTDSYVIEKINKNLKDDEKLQEMWSKMNDASIFTCNENEKKCEKVVVKSRIVDPLFFDEINIKKVSDIDEIWAKNVEINMRPKVYFLK